MKNIRQEDVRFAMEQDNNLMRVNSEGITRLVIIFKTVVVKIPRLRWSNNIWYSFLKGICANIEEHRTWEATKSELLCPVVWCSWGGWILIMKKADVDKWIKESEDINWSYAAHINAGFGDDKSSNYGYYKNKLVKIDYSY